MTLPANIPFQTGEFHTRLLDTVGTTEQLKCGDKW